MDENDVPQTQPTADDGSECDPKSIYTPLASNEVRLVLLHKVTDGDKTVKVDLITVTWSPSLEYEALSYVWGDPAIRKDILVSVEGSAPYQPVPVTVNLHAALSHLRHEDRDRVLWIDALCIDQTNVAEKEQQVRKMGEIYQTASNVCVWLGIETHLHGMDFVNILLGSIRGALENWSFDKVHKLRSFENVLQNRWFSRRWVIQEVALAKQATVHYGDVEVPWIDFSDAISLCESKKAKNPRFPASGAGGIGALTLSILSNNALRKGDDGRILERRWSVETSSPSCPCFKRRCRTTRSSRSFPWLRTALHSRTLTTAWHRRSFLPRSCGGSPNRLGLST